MKKFSHIVLLIALCSCSGIAKKETAWNATLYVSNLRQLEKDDLSGEDEVALVYSVNSYRESGTLYASSSGIYESGRLQQDVRQEVGCLASVPMVEDGHISASFSLVEIDAEGRNYKLSGHEGKVHYNPDVFTVFGRYKVNEQLIGAPGPCSWDMLSNTFELYGIDIKKHLEIGLFDSNDNLGCSRIDYRNEDLPEKASVKEAHFGGEDEDPGYRLSFYLKKSPASAWKNYKSKADSV